MHAWSCDEMHSPALSVCVCAVCCVLLSTGMGFDYTFINDAEASMYSQWAGWRRILSTVLSKGPEGLQVDNRQQNHE
jgi:hypothetical protein